MPERLKNEPRFGNIFIFAGFPLYVVSQIVPRFRRKSNSFAGGMAMLRNSAIVTWVCIILLAIWFIFF